LVAAGKALPADPNWIKKQTFPLTEYAALGAGISLEIKNLNDSRILTDGDNVAIRNHSVRLYFAGAIEYADQRGIIRKTAFCRVLNLPEKLNATDRGRFVRFNDPDYEYED
jgi:hypothetical protein